MRARFGANIRPAVLKRRSHAVLAGSGVFVRKNTVRNAGHVWRMLMSAERFVRYSSSWASPDESTFLLREEVLVIAAGRRMTSDDSSSLDSTHMSLDVLHSCKHTAQLAYSYAHDNSDKSPRQLHKPVKNTIYCGSAEL